MYADRPHVPALLARYTADGSLDGSFDGDGIATTQVLNPFAACQANALVLQGDGKLVVVGSA